MNPAYSIIFFTVSSGIGYGLLAALGLLGWNGRLPQVSAFVPVAAAFGFACVTAGLLSSTLHLGHPERAWRALGQWRSSWLSREGVFSLATYVPFLLFVFFWVTEGSTAPAVRWCGLLTTAGCAATVLCTGMIYASLRAVPDWNTSWVPWNYLALGAATGTVWLLLLATLFAVRLPGLSAAVPALIGLAFVLKLGYWHRRRSPVADRGSATGLGTALGRRGRVEILEPPHTEPNYLQREMGYVLARKHASRLREWTALLGYALPLMFSLLALTLPAGASVVAALVAAVGMTVGIAVERWLFFAEARHTVALYYHEAEV